MSLTPAEIRHVELRRGLFGYRRSDEVVDSFEQVWRERADLADKVEALENDLVRYRELETLLRTTLISAERASQELKEQARKQADTVVSEAHAEARSIVREAAARRERLLVESRRLQTMLRSALASLEDGGEEALPKAEAEAA